MGNGPPGEPAEVAAVVVLAVVVLAVVVLVGAAPGGVLGVVAAAHNASVHRSPTVAIEREHCPALVLFPEADQITERANDRVTRELTVRITALARAIPPLVAETEADGLLTAAHAAVMLDVNLAGLALGVREVDAEFDIEDARIGHRLHVVLRHTKRLCDLRRRLGAHDRIA